MASTLPDKETQHSVQASEVSDAGQPASAPEPSSSSPSECAQSVQGSAEPAAASPKVSVIMSIYRPPEGYLAEQLDSINAQDFDDMEVVVYNDCPEDPAWEDFCRAHITRYPLRYVQGEQNLGYVTAFQTLVGLAEGEYLAFCDQDDRWLAGRIARGVELLDQGYVLVCCDRQTIDGDGNLTCESWRAAHPHDASVSWHTDDHFTAEAAFTCYSLGMATMMRTDVARQLMPYPTITGHDKWLALGASAIGPCANIETPLVQYRLHGSNRSGLLRGIDCKADWHRMRTERTYQLVQEFVRRFPEAPEADTMMRFAQARLDGKVIDIWRSRHLAPSVARFEMMLNLVPDWMFKGMLRVLRHEKKKR